MSGPVRSHLFYQSRRRRPVLDRAEGVHMWDRQGRRYLDAASGAMVSNIGHSNPRVLAAMLAQMARATFAYRLHFESEAAEALAARLAGLAPPGLDRVFLVSGGSEAVESAIKLARAHALATGEPRRRKVLSLDPSYHGSTLGALALTGYAPLTEPFDAMICAMPKAPAPCAWADGLDPADPATGRHYARAMEAAIEAEDPGTVLGVIHEPVGGAATGALVPPAGYMAAVRALCDRHGLILIHDEVMSGAGRTGRYFAAEHWGVAPDITVLSKGLGAGYAPLGAMIADARLVEPVLDAGGFAHGHTYAGNPLAAAAGLAVIEEIERLELMRNAARMGAALAGRLRALMPRHRLIGDVRGLGLLQAIELVADRDSRVPLPAELRAHERAVELAHERGLILYSRRSRGGRLGDHLMICPPMILGPDDLDELIDRLDDTLAAFAAEIHGVPGVPA